MIKLTEEEFRNLYYGVFWSTLSADGRAKCFNSALEAAKQKGWIKKTALEEAEFIADELCKNRLVNLGIGDVLEMIEFYRQAIKEAQEEANDK